MQFMPTAVADDPQQKMIVAQRYENEFEDIF
jgi:hypothetical protein